MQPTLLPGFKRKDQTIREKIAGEQFAEHFSVLREKVFPGIHSCIF